jgi:uncharacterized membrane protein YfcA
MLGFSITSIILITVTFILAGVVKGVTGMGLPTVSMGVLGAIMPPVGAASLLLIPSFVTNVWQFVSGPDFRVLARRLWPMMLGIVVGTIAGARLLTGTNTKWTTVGLGVALAAYALHSLLARPLTVSKPPALITSPAPINWKAFRILSAYAEATGGTRVRGDRVARRHCDIFPG